MKTLGLILIFELAALIGTVVFIYFREKRYVRSAIGALFSALDDVRGGVSCVNDTLDAVIAYQDQTNRAIDTFMREFKVRFDTDLAKKLNSVLNLGSDPDKLMVRKDPATGKDEVVKVDEGW